MRNAFILGIVAVALPLLAVCSDEKSPPESPDSTKETELSEPRSALSEELMVALAQAKNFHHKADVHLKDAQLDEAIDSVKQVLSIAFPAHAPEARDVILDARSRLAKLLVTRGDLEEAMSVVNEGLQVTDESSFFLANLFTVRGHVWEAFAQRADENGNVEEGKKARRAALADFDRSITINKAVLKRLSKEPLK